MLMIAFSGNVIPSFVNWTTVDLPIKHSPLEYQSPKFPPVPFFACRWSEGDFERLRHRLEQCARFVRFDCVDVEREGLRELRTCRRFALGSLTEAPVG